MKQFFKYVMATIVGLICVGVFVFLMGLAMIGSMVAADSAKPSIKDGTVLRISLNGALAERSAPNPFAGLAGNDLLSQQGLDDLLNAIRVAQDNDKVRGIYLECGALSADYATVQELRKALADFKKSKKFVVSYADAYTQGTYYVASVSDKVFLNPSGLLAWHGISSQPIFYTDLLKKIGVNMQIFKVGKFKSAVEPFMLTSMSDANRQQVQSFIGDIWQNLCDDVSSSRKISKDSLNTYADRYTAFASADDYVRMRLVDSLVYADQMRDKLRAMLGGEKVSFISPAELVKLYEADKSGNQIAVYYAEGDIVDEASTSAFSSQTPQIVGAKVVEDLDGLANDEDVKAVVLRINSGGGSAYASEQMWRAIQLLKKKKPVVVSMSGMAASGGYYMSCGADYIVAEPTTLTGSIGIFGMVPDVSGLLTEKLGLHFDVVKTNESSDFVTPSRPLNAAESGAMQAYVDRGYSLFLKRVADGRKMKTAQVDNIAQGRVWTGQQALGLKLVDKLGTLDDAVAEAARRARLDSYSVGSYPAKASWMQQLAESVSKEDYMERKLRLALGEYYAPLRFAGTLSAQPSLQARIFFVPNLK